MATLEQTYLMTTDLARARRFYEGALGLSAAGVGEQSVSYETGEGELKIRADHDPATLESFNLSQPPDSGRGEGAVYVLRLSEPVDRVHERVADSLTVDGGELLTAPRDVPWGERMFLVRSPDGYTFEIRGDEAE